MDPGLAHVDAAHLNLSDLKSNGLIFAMRPRKAAASNLWSPDRPPSRPARRPAVEIRADPVDDRLGRVGTPAPAPWWTGAMDR